MSVQMEVQTQRGSCTLASLWDVAEQAQADKIAVIAGDRRLSYRDLGVYIRSLSANLYKRWHIRKDDVIALLAPNCPEFIISYFAVVRLGAIIQPLDERLMPEEMSTILADSQARFLIVHQALWPKAEQVVWGNGASKASIQKILNIGMAGPGIDTFDAWTDSMSVDESNIDAEPDDIAELMYTSGTTGEPKGVMRSHRNVRAASRNSIRGFGYTHDDVIAIVMPLSHSSALNSQMMPLVELGGTLLLMQRYDAAKLLSLIQAEGVTCMRAVPAMIRMLLALPNFQASALPTLRLIVNSSAPIDPHTYLEVKHRFQSIQVMNSYGLTEASTCTVLPDNMALTHPDSIGHAIEGVEIQVCDESQQPVQDGEEGEIWIRGEHVFAGYRHQPDRTRTVLMHGWLHTGDLAHRDEQGLYYLHGRRDDVINCGGRKFAPVDVENCILQLPQVLEAVAIGVPHPVLGQVAKVFVVLAGDAASDAVPDAKVITRHCARNLPSYKVPFYVEFVSGLPRNSTGKILRRKLPAHAHNIRRGSNVMTGEEKG